MHGHGLFKNEVCFHELLRYSILYHSKLILYSFRLYNWDIWYDAVGSVFLKTVNNLLDHTV
jgi:hypothetical protein